MPVSDSLPPRKRAQAISKAGPEAARIAFPHAFEAAAEVSARPLAAFLEDPTQLANGLAELARAIGSDGIVCLDGLGLDRVDAAAAASAPSLLASRRVAASLEATRRLRATFADGAALVVVVDGPAALAAAAAAGGEIDAGAIEDAGAVLSAVVRAFAEAGADLFLVDDPAEVSERDAWSDALTTASRVAKFHRGAAYVRAAGAASPLPSPAAIPLDAPAPAPRGVVTTSARVARLDLPAMTEWMRVVRLETA